MGIEAVVNGATSYQDLNAIVQKSRTSLSCFGYRVISVEGHEGTIYLDQLVNKWLTLNLKGGYRLGNKGEAAITVTDHSTAESQAVFAIQGKLQNHYLISDLRIRHSYNIFVVFSRTIKCFILAISSCFCMEEAISSSRLFTSFERYTLERGAAVIIRRGAFYEY